MSKDPGSCAPSRSEQSTSPSMWIHGLKSNMHEHRLITGQWWKPLTDARGTTNNDNGPQGTIGTIRDVWINELVSNTHGIIRSKVNDANLTSNTKNLPLRHAGSKAPEGSPYINFLDNELKSTGSDLDRRWAIMFPTSSTRDREIMLWIKIVRTIRGRLFLCRGQLLLNISAAH